MFTDHASGKLARRPQLDYIRPGDVVVITKLDRLGRSVSNRVELINLLGSRGVDLRVLHHGIDTTIPGGRLTVHILGSIAEFERGLISERTREGLQAARARGCRDGRRPKITPVKLAAVWRMYDGKEHTLQEIAEVIGVSRATVHRALVGQLELAVR